MSNSTFLEIIGAKLPIDDVVGLICTGFEGGMDWYVKRIWPEVPEGASLDHIGEDWRDFPQHFAPFVEGGYLILDVEDPDHDERIITTRVDLGMVKSALCIMRDKYTRHFADFISGQSDAITGDVFLQCLVYGKVIFG